MKTFQTICFGVIILIWSWISTSFCMDTSSTDLNDGAELLPLSYFILGTLSIMITLISSLRLFGQPWISKSGRIIFWTGEVNGPENSQQLTDWYTFSHVLHGFIFHYLTGLLPWEDVKVQLLLAFIVESAWEILENSPPVIKRYREQALAQGYSGDSIINSVSDNVAMAFGFWMTDVLPSSVIVTIAVVEEIISAAVIRDNLILNTIQLIYPMKFISEWQLAGHKKPE